MKMEIVGWSDFLKDISYPEKEAQANFPTKKGMVSEFWHASLKR